MQIEACIFDLDGVICDTAKYHYFAWRRLADQLGFEFTEADNERLKGVSRMESLDILLEIGGKVFDDETKQKLATQKNDWYVEYISQLRQDEILEGVKPFLDQLKAHNIKISLGSVSKNAELILNRLEIKGYFDAIIDGTKITKAKPDPEVFLAGAKALGISPERCIVFEDAVAGVEGAHRAGMKCVGVGSKEILHTADIVIPNFIGVDISLLNKLD